MYSNEGEVRFVDFGLAKQSRKKNERLTTVAGTPYFIAPEVLNGNYGKDCDIWSLGVVLFVMVTGTYPFDGNNKAEVFDLIKRGAYHIPPSAKSKVTPECLDMISKMIIVDRTKRYSGEQLIKHPWFVKTLGMKEGQVELLDPEILKKL